MHSQRIILRACLFLSVALPLAAGLAAPAQAQSADGLPIPPGLIITGQVFRGMAFNGYDCPTPTPCPGTSVPSIATGNDANQYLLPKYTDPSFTPGRAAVVVQTAVPTQYVRFYNPSFPANQAGNFIVGSNEVRGLTPEQVRAVMALPYTPTMETLVQVPIGTCLIIGPANPLFGQPGGAVQEFIIGASQGGAGCGPTPQYIPLGSYINGQSIGAFALAYAPRAGGGNTGAVAYALDRATPPALFTDMDSIYNALDVLNFGDSGPLRAALVQLDGEVYADVPSVAISAGKMFLDVLHDQTQLARGYTDPAGGNAWRIWMSGFGGGGSLSGNGDAHNVNFGGGGVSMGADRHFGPAIVAGVAAAYLQSSFDTNGISGNGNLNSLAVASYAGYTAGRWYAGGALGYSYNSAGATRRIDFPGVSRVAFGNLTDNAFLSRAEAGYRIRLDDRITATPFASFQGIVAGQNGFTEDGAGAAGLNVKGVTDASALSVLGGEVAYDLPVGLAVPLGISARAGWAHDFADVSRAIAANLQGTPDAGFTVSGARWPRDAAAAGVRLGLKSRQTDLFIRYDGLLAEGASINSATAGLRIAF